MDRYWFLPLAVFGLCFGIAWSGWRAFKENTLRDVMAETAKTTSLVFIILLGAAMLTAAFRAFGGEEVVTLPVKFTRRVLVTIQWLCS